MLNWLSLLPTSAAFIAFILSVLCLFAGVRTNFLTGGDLLTLYAPIGNETSFYDFYSIYVMSYCTGYLGDSNRASVVNLTRCSGHDLLFSFNPPQILSEDAGGNHTSLSELGLPSAINDDFRTFSIPTKSMGVFYCIGAGITAITILVRFGMLIGRKQSSRHLIFEVSALMIGFVSLGISSIIATVIAFQFVELINLHGRSTGVSASFGEQFLGMTWGAVGLLLVGSITGLAFMLVDHGTPRTGYVPPVEHQQPDENEEHKEAGVSETEQAPKA